MTEESVRVLVADDHPVVRRGLVSILEGDPRLSVVGQAANGNEAIEQYRRTRPDVAIIDLYMPEMGGIDAVAAIRAFDPKARIMIMTASASEADVYRGLRAGAQSYVLKDAPDDEVIKATLDTKKGRRYLAHGMGIKLADHVNFMGLSARELSILHLLADGHTNKSIGRMAGITEGTVKFHVNNILGKLQCSSRTEAVSLGLKRGLIRLT